VQQFAFSGSFISYYDQKVHDLNLSGWFWFSCLPGIVFVAQFRHNVAYYPGQVGLLLALPTPYFSHAGHEGSISMAKIQNHCMASLST